MNIINKGLHSVFHPVEINNCLDPIRFFFERDKRCSEGTGPEHR